MDRSLKFWIKNKDGLYYLCSENKGADQLCSSAPLISYDGAKSRFSHDAAHLILWHKLKCGYKNQYMNESITCSTQNCLNVLVGNM